MHFCYVLHITCMINSTVKRRSDVLIEFKKKNKTRLVKFPSNFKCWHASIEELFMSYICLVISVQGFWGAETRPIWNFSNRWSRLRHSSALSLSDRLCPIKTPALLSLMSVWKRLVPIFFYSPHSHTLLFKSISNIGMVLLEI